MSELPNGWVESNLSELLSADGLFSDGDWVESKDQDPNGSIRLLQLADIGDGYFIDKSSRFINEEKFALLRCTELSENDVLVARMPDPLGRACLLPRMPQRCVTVVDVAIFRTGTSGISSKWLMHTINAPQFRAEIELNSSGTTRKRISRGNLAGMTLPLPPLPEQKRIADKLDTVLARVDACRDRLDRLPALLKRFRQSILAAATSGRLTEDWRLTSGCSINDWKPTSIENLATVVRGASPRPAGDPKYFGGECPWITVGEITKDDYKYLRSTSSFVTAEGKEKSRFIERGTLLLTNSGATLGVPKITLIGGCINDGSVALLNLSDPLKTFLYWHLKGLTEYLRGLNQGAAQPNLNTGIVKNIAVHLPLDEEQHEIVRRVEILFAFADRLEARLATARKQVEQLTPALLAKAFRGELVPQDPADEPASELLKRLAAQREATPPGKGCRRKA